jgi:hypothetical protein
MEHGIGLGFKLDCLYIKMTKMRGFRNPKV